MLWGFVYDLAKQFCNGQAHWERTCVWPKRRSPIFMVKKLPAMPASAAMVSSAPYARPRFAGAKMSATRELHTGCTSASPTPVRPAHAAAWYAAHALVSVSVVTRAWYVSPGSSSLGCGANCQSVLFARRHCRKTSGLFRRNEFSAADARGRTSAKCLANPKAA